MAIFYALLLVTAYISTCSALPPCTCTRMYAPVCGSDDVTYPNLCNLECQQTETPGLTLKSEGPCPETLPVCICPYNYAPVCGTDGKTYGNECSLNCAKKLKADLGLASQGECKSEQVKVVEPEKIESGRVKVVESYEPVQPAEPKDEVKVAEQVKEDPKEQVKVAESETPLPSCVCPRLLRPVCGTNFKTYANPCLLNCAAEVLHPYELHIYHEGACDLSKVVTRSCACGRDFKPVCASNGVTYANTCLLKCNGENLTVRNAGPCDSFA